MYVCVCIYVCVYMYVCMCVYICMCNCSDIHEKYLVQLYLNDDSATLTLDKLVCVCVCFSHSGNVYGVCNTVWHKNFTVIKFYGLPLNR